MNEILRYAQNDDTVKDVLLNSFQHLCIMCTSSNMDEILRYAQNDEYKKNRPAELVSASVYNVHK